MELDGQQGWSKQAARLSLIGGTVGLPRTVAGKRSRHRIHSSFTLFLIGEIRETDTGGQRLLSFQMEPWWLQVDAAGSVDDNGRAIDRWTKQSPARPFSMIFG